MIEFSNNIKFNKLILPGVYKNAKSGGRYLSGGEL